MRSCWGHVPRQSVFVGNCPCTYVNTEHQDARSHHSERCGDGSHPPKKNIHSIYLNTTSADEPIYEDLIFKIHICMHLNISPLNPNNSKRDNLLQLFPERPMNSLVSAFQRYVFRSSIFWCRVLLGKGLRFHRSKFRSSCSRGWCSANSSCSSSSSWPCLRMTL